MNLSNPESKYNVIFMGNFSYPDGMAGGTRIQHAIHCLDDKRHSCSVVVYGRSAEAKKKNTRRGKHKGTPHLQTSYPRQLTWSLPLKALKSYKDIFRYMKRRYKSEAKNIIYHYKGPNIENFSFLSYARYLGYKILFDITEDIESKEHFPHVLHKLKIESARLLRCRPGYLTDGLIVVSEHLRKKFYHRLPKKIPLWLRPISVNLDQFHGATESFHSPVRIFYGGSFARKDGVEYLIEAFDQVCEQYADVRLILTGKGKSSRMEAIRKKIRETNHGGRIELTGYLPEERYVETVKNCDIACLTRIESPYAKGGFPFKLGEYLAAEKPVIASDVAGIGKFLDHGKEVYFVEPGSVKSIVNGLTFYLEQPEQARRIGNRGRLIARNHFSVRSQKEEFLDFLNRV